MAVAPCIEIETPPAPPSIEIPQFGILEAARQGLYDIPDPSVYLLKMQDLLANAMAPLRRFLDLLGIILALKDCITAVIDALLPPSPGPIIECLEKFGIALEKIIALVPPLNYIPLLVDLCSYAVQTIDEIWALFQLLDERITEQKARLATALELGDLELAHVADCQTGEINALVVNAGDLLRMLQPLFEVILTPLAALVPGPPGKQMKQTIKTLSDIPGTIAAVQDGIRNQTAGVAVLGTLLDTMFSMREAIRFMHNLLLPLAAGRSGSIASKSAPDLVNF